MNSISPLGTSTEEIWNNYQIDGHFFIKKQLGSSAEWVATLSEKARLDIERLRNSDTKYAHLDDSVLYAIYVARKAVGQAGWQEDSNFGINLGSSRGATGLFEKISRSFFVITCYGYPYFPNHYLGKHLFLGSP